MAMLCPLCSIPGAILIVSAVAVLFLSSYWPILFWPGIALAVAAYTVPFLLRKKVCDDGTCERK